MSLEASSPSYFLICSIHACTVFSTEPAIVGAHSLFKIIKEYFFSCVAKIGHSYPRVLLCILLDEKLVVTSAAFFIYYLWNLFGKVIVIHKLNGNMLIRDSFFKTDDSRVEGLHTLDAFYSHMCNVDIWITIKPCLSKLYGNLRASSLKELLSWSAESVWQFPSWSFNNVKTSECIYAYVRPNKIFQLVNYFLIFNLSCV